MSYAQLRAFHAVALEGTIQKAADRLKLTQPAISIHLKQLENESGKRLFRRSGHRFELNEDGKILFEATSRMIRADRDAKQLLSPYSGVYRGTLIVGADGPHVALAIIDAFRLEHPSIQIEAVLSNASGTWSDMLNLRVDVAVLAGSPEDPRVHKRHVVRQSLVAVIPTTHPLAKQRSIDLRGLCDEPLIFREDGSSTQRKVQSGLLHNRLSVTPALILGSREAVFAAVTRGMGIGFAYDREIGNDSRISAIPIIGFEGANIDEVVCMKHQRNAPLVANFIACAEKLYSTD